MCSGRLKKEQGERWNNSPVGKKQGRLLERVQFSSVAQSCPALCHPMDCSTPGFPAITNSQNLLKLMFMVLVMPSNYFILCHPLLLLPSIFPIIRVFSSESALRIRWPKYQSFSFSISPSNEYSGLISFRINWFDLLAVQGLSRVFSSTTVGKHQFFSAQPSLWPNSHRITGKTIALTIQNLFYTIHEFVLFNGLLSFAIIIYFDAQIVQKWARVPFTLISVSLIFYP